MSFEIYLLGQFKLQANDLVIELPSRPAQSLLAYLALNAGVTQRREKLAALLWPEATETNARSYLRQALWRLRKSLESSALAWGDYLHINDISVCFDDQSNFWLDAALLLEPVEARSESEVIEIVRLYHGELLPGFYDEWIVLERDRLQAAYHQKMNLLLERLIHRRQWDEALVWSEQWIQLGYSPEPAYRALMNAYAGLGDLGMVNATYQRCVQALDRELALEPSPETHRLYEQIRSVELEVTLPPSPPHIELTGKRPPFLDEGEALPLEKPFFVARERELARLDEFLDLALASQGRVIFITGEAGSGKTTLFQEFTRSAQETHADLIVAIGNCNAQTGIGDPYLPFREVVELLTGDVESRWAAGAISREHALRLWNTLPLTDQALVETGLDLIDTFIPGIPLLERARACSHSGGEWLTRLVRIVERKEPDRIVHGPGQSDLFEQYTRLLGALARKVPLLLVVDDLQWADLGSISLLFHLGRNLPGSRILIVGAYRPEEVAIGREGERHPLASVVSEFQRQFGDILVDLDQAERRDFVAAILDSEPNRLGDPFREMLYRQTRGHPLCTTELLRGMQERGDLVQDKQGQWVEGAALDWETLPARVEAVIAERIDRLDEHLQSVLRVASVEGETFTAEVVARVQAAGEREIVGLLSGELDRRHRLIRAQSIERLGSRRVSRYRFRNYLFQKYLYDDLDEVERAYLHEDVGYMLEELYGDQASNIAVQLARHFQEARITEKAIHYLHQAGEKAVQLSAYQEAIAHLTTGLELLTTLPDSPERAQGELALQLALGTASIGNIPGPEWKNAYTRARELSQQTGDATQLCRILGELSLLPYLRAEYHSARELAEEALNLAQSTDDPLLVGSSAWYLGLALFALGEYRNAQDHFRQIISFYEPHKHHQPLVSLRGSDAGLSAQAYDACCLWCLGYPDQALSRSQQALELARQFDHAFSSADVLCFAGCILNMMRRDAEALKETAEELSRLAHEKSLTNWIAAGIRYRGVALAMLGQVEEGITFMQESMQADQSSSILLYIPGTLCSLAETYLTAGQPEECLVALDKAFALVEETDERHWEAELYRLRAELLLVQGDEAEAEASLHKAIQVARRQQAKSWELRSGIDLARLWHSQGRTDQAHQMLAEIYNWFTEGFDTQDLKEARALLEEMS